jgi:putative transposase
VDYQRDEHRVHLIFYHLVWTPKRRKALLVGEIERECRALIEQACRDAGWEIHQLMVRPDHVHLFVRVWPTTSAADVVKTCKSRTSHVLREHYAVLRKLPSLWTRSYLASTAGNVSGQTIERYIAAQKGL